MISIGKNKTVTATIIGEWSSGSIVGLKVSRSVFNFLVYLDQKIESYYSKLLYLTFQH